MNDSMNFEEELKLLKIAEQIDEDIQLQQCKFVGEIADRMIFQDEGYSKTITKLFSLLVTQLPSEDDMVTSELRKMYNTAVMEIAEGLYDPIDFDPNDDNDRCPF